MYSEYFINHSQLNDPNFSKVYSKYRRLHHHYLYLKCLFIIEEINSNETFFLNLKLKNKFKCTNDN